jgi:hypothetical protein
MTGRFRAATIRDKLSEKSNDFSHAKSERVTAAKSICLYPHFRGGFWPD